MVLEWHLHVTVKAFIKRLNPLLVLRETKMCSHSRNVLILKVTHRKVTRNQARTCKSKQELFCPEKGGKWNGFGFLRGSVRISESFVNSVLGRSEFQLVSQCHVFTACSSSPCLHDGTCILDTSYTYHCACLAGYTGKRCENGECGLKLKPLWLPK